MTAFDPIARALALRAGTAARHLPPMPKPLKPASTFPVFTGDSTVFQMAQNGGTNLRLAQLATAGQIAQGLPGWVNLGSSGYSLENFVSTPANPAWGGPSPGNPDWSHQGAKTGATAPAISTSLADLTAWLPTLDPSLTPVVCIGLGHNDWGKSVAVGTLSLADLTAYHVTRFRVAVEGIKAARSNAVILLMVQNRVLARPYGGTVPIAATWNAGGAPGFGIDLAADTALLAKVDAAQIAAKYKVAGEYGHVQVWDLQKEVLGFPDYGTDTPANWPIMADNGHPSAPAYNAMADSLARILFGNPLTVPKGRMELADRIAVLNGSRSEENYARYCEGHPDRFTRAFDGYSSGIGPNYLDISVISQAGSATAISLWNVAIRGRTPIYVQIGDAACQRFASYAAAATGNAAVRLSAIAPSAAMQALTNQLLPVRVYVEREITTGDADIDGYLGTTTNREVWPATIANAGSGFMDVAFDKSLGMFSIQKWRSMTGMNLRIGGTVLTTEDLSTWSLVTWTETAGTRQVRILKTGDWSARIGTRAALLVSPGVAGPGAQMTQIAVAACADLTAARAMGVCQKPLPGVSQYVVSSGIAETAPVTGTVYRTTTGGVRTLISAFTINSNAINATLTPGGTIDWLAGDLLEVVRTSGAPAVANTSLVARTVLP